MKKPRFSHWRVLVIMTALTLCSLIRLMLLGVTFMQISSMLFLAGIIGSFIYLFF